MIEMMIEFDPFTLARIQFALNISFHILFPTITIGLCWILLLFRSLYTMTGNKNWEYAYFFWIKIFALTFALGVVSGITMSFQFGTNWPGFMEKTGDISGPLLGFEVLTAFFLEASFLGIMLFGKNRVSNRMHLFSCCMVALGTTLSAFWILSLNSWMHTPDGYIIENGTFIVDDWWKIIFNPSFPYRFAHMFVASILTSAFMVIGISAWRTRSKVDGAETRYVMYTGVIIAAIFTPIQILIGDLHGLNTLEHQPAKIAAIEAIWETEKGADLTLIGFPDEEQSTTHYAVKLPKMASLILKHDLDGELQGINDFDGEHPPVAFLFWAFRIMVGVGMMMLLVSWSALWVMSRNKKPNDLLLRSMSLMTFSGWVAVLAGWYVTEVGRQPWIVYGELKTIDVVANHPPELVLSSLIGYALMYLFLLISYISVVRYISTKPARSLTLLQKYPDTTHKFSGD